MYEHNIDIPYDYPCSSSNLYYPNPYYSTLNFEHLLRSIIGTTKDMDLLNDEITINTCFNSTPSFVNQQSIIETDYMELFDLLQDYYNLRNNYVEINSAFHEDEAKEIINTMDKMQKLCEEKIHEYAETKRDKLRILYKIKKDEFLNNLSKAEDKYLK